MDTLVLIRQMTEIALLVLLGIFLGKKNRIDEHTAQKLSAIVMDIVNPAMILSTVLSGGITGGRGKILAALGAGAGFYAFLCVLGVVFPKLFRVPKSERTDYNMMVVYTNVGFIGIPVGRALLGSEGMLYVIICNVMYSLLFYTHGVSVLGNSGRIRIRSVFSPGTCMVLLSLLLICFPVHLPEVLTETVSYIGNATVFLSMSLLGVSLARVKSLRGIASPWIWVYIAIRMVAIPILLVSVLRRAGAPGTMVQAFCLMAAMPAANLPLIQAEKIGRNTAVLSQGIVISTVVSFVSITALMSWLF
jgi:predicted permease